MKTFIYSTKTKSFSYKSIDVSDFNSEEDCGKFIEEYLLDHDLLFVDYKDDFIKITPNRNTSGKVNGYNVKKDDEEGFVKYGFEAIRYFLK